MLSSVSPSPTAIRVNIEIMRTFVRLRRLIATPGEIVEQLRELTETVELYDDQIHSIATVLKQLLQQPPKSKRPIGFNQGN
jgi:hypothetical protein